MCATTTKYVFSGSKVVAEYVNGALSKEYVYAGSTLLVSVAADGTPTYHHADHLSIRSDSDANGNQIRSYGHFPFGETWYEEGAAAPGKWKFTSYERDGESGLDYAMFRYDSSRLGRFMSPDPLAGNIANPQSLNRYSYVGNDPVNLVDPLGLNECSRFAGRDSHGDPIFVTIPCEGRDRGSEGWGSSVPPAPGACGTSTIDGFDAGGTCHPHGPRTVQVDRTDPSTGGGTKEKPPEQEARDKAFQDCLDRAAKDRARAFAALSAVLTARLSTRLAANATIFGFVGAGAALLTGHDPRGGTLFGAGMGALATAAFEATSSSRNTIPQAQAAINDAYMNRVLKDCILPNLAPRPPQ